MAEPAVHVIETIGGVEVWLDPDGQRGTGLVLGTGPTVRQAMNEAAQELREVLLAIEKVLTAGRPVSVEIRE